jgi:hypothetical protein
VLLQDKAHEMRLVMQEWPSDIPSRFEPSLLPTLVQRYARHGTLRVGFTRFGSPGLTDLIGAGKVLEQVRLFLTDITDRVLQRRDRDLKREEDEQKILAMKIKNAERLLGLAKEVGLNEDEKKRVIARLIRSDDFFETAITGWMITKIELSPPDPASSRDVSA